MPLGLQFARPLAVATVLAAAAGVCPADDPKPEPGEPFLLNKAAAPPRALGRAAAIALSPFQPAGVSTRIRRTLLQWEALVADEAWDEAIELIETLQTEAGDQLTKLPAVESSPIGSPEEHARYAPLRQRCQELLASMPPAGLEAYRDRVGRTARQRLDDAVERLDERGATRVATEFSASEAAVDARLAAAELALQRGDATATRRHLQAMDRLARDPYGRPAAASLARLRTDIDPARLADAWREAAGPEAATAQDDLTPTVLARLALASLSEGDLRRASAEQRLLNALAPDALGRIAGRHQPLGSTIGALISEKRSDAAGRSRASVGELAWAWESAAPMAVSPARSQPTPPTAIQFRGNGLLWQRQLAAQQALQNRMRSQTTGVAPVSQGLSAFYVEANKVKRLRLTDGEITEIKLPGVPDTAPVLALDPAPQRIVLQGGRMVRLAQQPVRQNSAHRIDSALAFSGGLLFARVVESHRRAKRAGQLLPGNETLIGIDPSKPTTAVVRIAAPRDPENAAANWQFGGPPVVRGDRLYVAMTTPGGRVNVGVACYSTATGRRRWFTELGSGSAVPRLGGGVIASVTPAGDTLYAATELGAVAAIESASGRVRWIAQYPRDAQVGGFQPAQALAPARPCHVVGDQVLAAPSGSTRLFAWDATSGRPLWDAPRPDDASIAGVVGSADGSVVVLAGRQVTAYDTLTGRQRLAWPDSPHAGLRGGGLATVVGDEVFWPTRDTIYAIDPVRGGFTRPPIDLSPVGSEGANLIPTDAGLLVCGPKRLRLLADPGNPERRADLSRLMDGAPRRLTAGRSRNLTGDARR